MLGVRRREPHHATGEVEKGKPAGEQYILGAKGSVDSLKHQAVLGLRGFNSGPGSHRRIIWSSEISASAKTHER